MYLVHLIISSYDTIGWCFGAGYVFFPAKQTRILKKVVQKQIIFILKFFLYAYKVLGDNRAIRAPSTEKAEIGHCRVGCRVVDDSVLTALEKHSFTSTCN